ncbi:MAG: ABC transporter permease [Clostridia bacterium]|nr:ABC transporter permease [Clostridia bacterium]
MKTVNFAKRNFKEIIRDPLSVIFAIMLPLFLLFIFQQFKIPSEIYKIENFTPGIIVFSFSFIAMFTATLVAKDRTTSLLTRLCASPMKPRQYILGYTLAILPIVLIQNILFFVVAIFLGLSFNINVIFTILISFIISILFINLGIFIGCVTNEKSSAGVSSVIVQLVAFTSGMYFETEMVGAFFGRICDILPFSHCLQIVKWVLNRNSDNIYASVIIVLAYMIFTILLASVLFKKKLESNNK